MIRIAKKMEKMVQKKNAVSAAGGAGGARPGGGRGPDAGAWRPDGVRGPRRPPSLLDTGEASSWGGGPRGSPDPRPGEKVPG